MKICNFYIDKLDDIVNKYNNANHHTVKTKPIDVKSNTYISFNKKMIVKIVNLKLMIFLEYQNMKTFLQNITLQIGLKKFVWLKNVKNTVLWTYVISDPKGEEFFGTFYEKRIAKNKSKRI